MKISYIVPTAYIKQFGNQGQFHLALSHLCDMRCENRYATALKESDLPIYLDNGAFENGVPEEATALMRKAILLKAEYVFAPDYLFDHRATALALKRMIDFKRQMNIDIKIAAVVQASHFTTWLDFYQELVRNPDVDLIGLSILSIPMAFKKLTGTTDITTNRMRMINEVNELKQQKDSHLLGLGDSLEDLVYAKEVAPWIKSHDSSSVFMCGLYDKLYGAGDTYNIPRGKPEEKVNFDERDLTPKRQQAVQFNIDYLTKILR